MARRTEAERVDTWMGRFRSADKLYERWSDRFKTRNLEEYYNGKQWMGTPETDAQRRYTINLIFATVETNRPSLSFYRPQVRVQPRPARVDDALMKAEARARLAQDTVQTFIDDPDIHFDIETALALHEAHFRFGVIEVGYTSDWIDNPDAGRPMLKDDKEEMLDAEGRTVPQPRYITTKEDLYVRHVPAHTFRVSISNRNILKRNDWCGYWEWHRLDDLRANRNYNTNGLKATGYVEKDLRSGDTDDQLEMEARHGMVKVWKVWDLRTYRRHVLAEGHKKFLVEDVKFHTCPFSIMKFHEILNSFYPLPPVFQWIHPQDAVNDTREAQRAHQKRFYRRYTHVRGAIDPSELDKLETGGDGAIAESNVPNPIQPVPDAPMSGDVSIDLRESRVDFMQVSGTGGDQRGVAESETATQASIIDTRARVREASARTKVSDWLALVARLMLLVLRHDMALEFWVRRNIDPVGPDPEEVMRIATLWEQITSDELGDLDVDVSIDLASMSPISEEVQRGEWNQVLALLTNPSLLMLLSMSELLLRKTLSLYGVKSEREVREIMRVIQDIMRVQAAQAAMEAEAAAMKGTGSSKGGGGVGPSAAPPRIAAGPNNGTAPPGQGTEAMNRMLNGIAQISRAGG